MDFRQGISAPRNMKACEVVDEELPLAQQQPQRRSPHQQPRKKRTDEGRTSTSEAAQNQQLKPNELDGPSRSSVSSVESAEVVHVRRPKMTTKSVQLHNYIAMTRKELCKDSTMHVRRSSAIT